MSSQSRRTLARLFAPHRRLLAGTLVVSILQAAVLLPVALIVRHVFDTSVPRGDVAGVVWYGAAVMVLYLASSVLALWTRYAVLKITKGAVADLRYRLVERVVSFPKAYFDKTRTSSLHTSIVWDSERFDLMTTALIQLLPAVMVSLGLSAVLLVLNPLLFLVLVCVVPVLIAVSRLLGRRVRRRTRVWQAALELFSSQTQLALRAITLIKVHAAEPLELARRRRQIGELAEAGRQMAWLQATYALVEGAVAASAGVIVLVVGGAAVARGRMTLGELLSFYAVLALLLRQVNVILSNVPLVMAGDEALRRLNKVLEANEPEPYQGRRPVTFRGTLALDGVSFGYGDEPILQGVSLRIEPGEHVALVGPNGAGKSTLLSLMLGLYRPQAGRLTADDIPYDDLDLRDLRRQIGVVLQDPVIFPATIRENISYGRADVTDEEIRRAAGWATADFFDDLPGGLETDAGDEGGLLSGGQRQRIAIARALFGCPALLVLDEPTTHLDDASVVRLMENLRHLPREPALLVITHDLEVARQADTIHDLRDGRIVATDEAREVRAPLRLGTGGSS